MLGNPNPFTLLIVLGIVAIIIEIVIGAATGFELLVLGIVFIIGGGIGILTGSLMAALISIILIIAGYIFLGRKMIKKALHITTTKTNSDALVGQTGIVTSEITPNVPGQAKVEGEVWRAESDTHIARGAKVTVVSVSGVTVKVEKTV